MNDAYRAEVAQQPPHHAAQGALRRGGLGAALARAQGALDEGTAAGVRLPHLRGGGAAPRCSCSIGMATAWQRGPPRRPTSGKRGENWWRRRESNPRPKALPFLALHACPCFVVIRRVEHEHPLRRTIPD